MFDYEGVLRGKCLSNKCKCYDHAGSGLTCTGCGCKSSRHLLVYAPLHAANRRASVIPGGRSRQRSKVSESGNDEPEGSLGFHDPTPEVKAWIHRVHTMMDRRTYLLSVIDELCTTPWSADDWSSFCEHGGVQSLRSAASHWSFSSEAMASVLRVFFLLCVQDLADPSRGLRARAVAAGALDTTLHAMRQYRGSTTVQEWGVRFLALLPSDPSIRGPIMSSEAAAAVSWARKVFHQSHSTGLKTLAQQCQASLEQLGSQCFRTQQRVRRTGAAN